MIAAILIGINVAVFLVLCNQIYFKLVENKIEISQSKTLFTSYWFMLVILHYFWPIRILVFFYYWNDKYM